VTWDTVEDHLKLEHLLNLYTKPILIGFSGKLGSGKDTCADIMVKHRNFERRSFATRVRATVAGLTGLRLKDVSSRESKKIVPSGFTYTIGQLLQIVGAGMKQLICSDVWITPVISSCGARCLITDCRYPEEASAIEAKGGFVIRIEGDPARIRELNEDGRDLNHPSETALDDYSFELVIENSGSLEQLEEKLLVTVVTKLYS